MSMSMKLCSMRCISAKGGKQSFTASVLISDSEKVSSIPTEIEDYGEAKIMSSFTLPLSRRRSNQPSGEEGDRFLRLSKSKESKEKSPFKN